MHLVQILLPLTDNDRHPFPRDQFDAVALEMTERFGGVTAFTRTPAEGRWKGHADARSEEMIVIEVMVDDLDKAWWATYRAGLEAKFRQIKVVVRAQKVQVL